MNSSGINKKTGAHLPVTPASGNMGIDITESTESAPSIPFVETSESTYFKTFSESLPPQHVAKDLEEYKDLNTADVINPQPTPLLTRSKEIRAAMNKILSVRPYTGSTAVPYRTLCAFCKNYLGFTVVTEVTNLPNERCIVECKAHNGMVLGQYEGYQDQPQRNKDEAAKDALRMLNATSETPEEYQKAYNEVFKPLLYKRVEDIYKADFKKYKDEARKAYDWSTLPE